MRAGSLRKGGKAEAILGFLQAQARPCTTREIADGTGEPVRRIWVRMFEMSAAGHVVKVVGEGEPVRFEAVSRGDVGPALAMPLPAVPAAMPTDRSLRPHVGVVVLLDRKAA